MVSNRFDGAVDRGRIIDAHLDRVEAAAAQEQPDDVGVDVEDGGLVSGGGAEPDGSSYPGDGELVELRIAGPQLDLGTGRQIEPAGPCAERIHQCLCLSGGGCRAGLDPDHIDPLLVEVLDSHEPDIVLLPVDPRRGVPDGTSVDGGHARQLCDGRQFSRTDLGRCGRRLGPLSRVPQVLGGKANMVGNIELPPLPDGGVERSWDAQHPHRRDGGGDRENGQQGAERMLLELPQGLLVERHRASPPRSTTCPSRTSTTRCA